MADMTSTEDPFDEFDVDSGSEKEFLVANLRNDAPEDAVEQLKEAGKSVSSNFSNNTLQRQNATVGYPGATPRPAGEG